MNLYQWALLLPRLLKTAIPYCPTWALLPPCALSFIIALLINRRVFIVLFIDYVSSVGQEPHGFLLVLCSDLSPASRIALKYLLNTWRSYPSLPRVSLRHWPQGRLGPQLSSPLYWFFLLGLIMVDNPLIAKHSAPALTELSQVLMACVQCPLGCLTVASNLWTNQELTLPLLLCYHHNVCVLAHTHTHTHTHTHPLTLSFSPLCRWH